METVLGTMLRLGVAVSIAFLAAGIALMLARHPDYLTDPGALGSLTGPGALFPHTLRDVIHGVMRFQEHALMMAGLLLLILTPVSRVAASIVAFVFERNWRFAAITAFVLVVLVVSFFLGKAG
jgi:uncharacterized membrane protein